MIREVTLRRFKRFADETFDVRDHVILAGPNNCGKTTVLQQADLVAGLESPGILYLEGYTDLNLLREWARILGHPASVYLNQSPFWRAKQSPGREDAAEVSAKDHFEALRLVNDQMTGLWMIDADGKANVPASVRPERRQLNRVVWQRYESESYLVHPAALARFIDAQAGSGGIEAVRKFLAAALDRYAGAGVGAAIADAFIAAPGNPSQLVETFLRETKARTTIVGGILAEGGVHGFPYTRFNEIAAQMRADEIPAEVTEKLDFLQQAFGL